MEKTKKATQHIFVHTLRCQCSLSVIKPGKFQDYSGASQIRAYRAEGLITQPKFHCPPFPEISFQKERIWGVLLPVFLQLFSVQSLLSFYIISLPCSKQLVWQAQRHLKNFNQVKSVCKTDEGFKMRRWERPTWQYTYNFF